MHTKTTHVRRHDWIYDKNGEEHKIFDPGVITISTIIHKDIADKRNKIVYGVSFCTPTDQFCKKQGHRIASQRCGQALNDAIFPHGYDIILGNQIWAGHYTLTHREIVLKVLCDIYGSGNFPISLKELLLSAIMYYTDKILGE